MIGALRGLLFAASFFAVAGILLPAAAPAAPARAMAACRSSKPAVSIKGCTQVIESAQASKKDKAIAHYNRGNAYANESDDDNAITDYTKSIEFNPKFAFAWFNRGNSHFNNGDLDKAIGDYTAALKLNPRYVPAYINRGNAYRDTGDYAKAFPDYDRALKLEPGNKLAQANREEAKASQAAEPAAGPDVHVEEASVSEPTAAKEGQQVATRETPAESTAAAAAIPAGKRVALVIGNSAYTAVQPLKNPKNDAELMAETLRTVGFDVEVLLDADQAGMKRAMLDFGRKLRGGVDAGLFYYSGHGVQANGRNYLIPVTAAIKDEDEVAIEAVDVNDFLGTMESSASKVNIVVLDACRNNPFPGTFRSASRGLSVVTAPRGTYIAYSTAPGSVAEDGTGDNSTYTKSLAQAIVAPGMTLEQTFKEVRRLVASATADKQVTWDSSSITGNFYFKQQ
jgi:tetratricopeptide (TPR) repeat protein